MSRRTALSALATAAVLALGATAPEEALPPEVRAYRNDYESALRAAEENLQRTQRGLELTYADKLRQLMYAMQYAGRIRDLLNIYDEYVRFQTKRALPTPTPAMEPAELRILAEEHVKAVRTAEYSNHVAIARAAATYLQNLAMLRRTLAERAEPDVLLQIDAERDRLLTNARVRTAVVSAAAGIVIPTNFVVAAEGPGSSTEGERVLRLYRLGSEDAATLMAYSLEVGMVEDLSRLREVKTETTRSRSESRSGTVVYRFRVTITARNAEVPAGSRLIVEYFARSLTDGSKRYHSSEQTLVPWIGRGESHTAEFNGISLYRSESQTIQSRGSGRSFSGEEFHGIIVSLLDPEGRVILQRFHPQSLSKDVIATPGMR
ncbi:MAG: hypothetical protein N2652_09515 [Kiritimatiellae bacterium]|nr:hypothetical protein [Kiritimatiellia bacterium]